MKSPTVVDLYSGVGGLSLGLEQAGFHVVAGVEIEEIAGRYAQFNFPSTKMLYGETSGDVKRFTPEMYEAVVGNPEGLFLVVGGPPCQGFSVAGKKRKDDPLNDLVLEFARVVDTFRPQAFLMENVPGLKTSDSPMLGRALKKMAANYDIVGPAELKAWEFGVPQMRRRVFILGIERSIGIAPSLPTATHYRPTDQTSLMLTPCPTCWDAISDIPPVDEYPELISGDRVSYTADPSNSYQKEMRGMTRAASDFSSLVKWDKLTCTNLRRTQHGNNLLERFETLGFGKTEKSSRIRRLDPRDISTTIRAGTTKARGSWSAPRPLHPYQPRVLTTRECARVQSFPDWFLFHPVKWHGNRMVGNAVPPLLARAIGLHIRSLFGLPSPPKTKRIVNRDDSLVAKDIENAKNSGYEGRKVSQLVVSWGKNARLPESRSE